MIDWAGVGIGALWVSGLALNLAALSLADYWRARSGRKWREVWAGRPYQLAHHFGLLLFCLGLLGSAGTVWERALWALLAAAFAVMGAAGRREKRGK
ncbi:MAG: hypothetical protein HY872_03985 [Chloroflexi bacterium]|nr:hypothetical protein [Chloroflexota bacterium]